MSVVAMEILFLVMGGLAGFGVGFWLRRDASQASQPTRTPAAEQPRAKPIGDVLSPKRAEASRARMLEESRARVVLAHLRELAAGVAANVGEHNNRVRAINEELNASNEHESAVVVAAVSKLIQANENMQKQLDSAEKKLREQARRLETSETQARTDSLTQLANRRVFDEEIAKCLTRFERSGQPTTVMMLDVDHFKQFNDTHGHVAGDEVLQGVARVLKDNVKASDIVARYGGEEFAVIFADLPIGPCKETAEGARAAIAEAGFPFEGVELRVTASIGLAELLPDEDAPTLVKRADDALYVSKEAGRNCSHWHDGHTIHPLTPRVEEQSEEPLNDERSEFAQKQPATNKPKGTPRDAEQTPDGDKHDALAAVAKQTAFCQEVQRRVTEFKQSGSPVCILLVRVDDFPSICEQHNQQGGDIALRAVSQFLKATMRDTDQVIRFNEDLFAMLLPSLELPDAVNMAERLREAIARCRIPLNDGELRFTISLGVSESLEDDEWDSLISRAERSLSAAVGDGRNRCYFHDGERCGPAAAWQAEGVVA